jgi:hypothetical protein
VEPTRTSGHSTNQASKLQTTNEPARSSMHSAPNGRAHGVQSISAELVRPLSGQAFEILTDGYLESRHTVAGSASESIVQHAWKSAGIRRGSGIHSRACAQARGSARGIQPGAQARCS